MPLRAEHVQLPFRANDEAMLLAFGLDEDVGQECVVDAEPELVIPAFAQAAWWRRARRDWSTGS